MEYTLTYSEQVQGWVSFYSFIPDWMIGMNNYFYTFKGGNLYRHSSNATRNNFYGIQYSSTIKSVFNDVPLENKLFKTLDIQGDDVWSATLITDIQDSGFVESGWYEKKEQVYFSFIRNSGTTPALPSEFALRSLGGIGSSYLISNSPSVANVYFSTAISLGSIMSVGDYLYFADGSSSTGISLAGVITEISRNLTIVNQNYIRIDTAIPGAAVMVGNVLYFLYMKNAVAESHGVLGHYCVFTLENVNTSKVEIFTLQSEVMKSYP